MNPLSLYDPDDPYPESDGKPMAESTEQYEWLVKIKENLECLFAGDPQVFVAGDLFWYPVRDRSVADAMAPDVMVAFGRPKGVRRCYKQWEEADIAPQVVFEIRSPSNGPKDMAEKLAYYDRFGVEEYYVYDPPRNHLEVWLRQDGRLKRMSHLKGWTSPRLGIRFALGGKTLAIFDPHGQPFLTSVERAERLRREQARAEDGHRRAEEAHRRAELEAARAHEERTRADRVEVLAAAAITRAEHEAAQAARQTARAEREGLRADEEHQRAELATAQAAAAGARAEQERARAERLAERLRELGVEP
ncbi:Uma2 family endonuclease [uncultured Thiodictyon sp.]|jgi:Uma2 family endonuclease|uniref:Uma2 family endonuclease n=1 Tax=uncultured Thiodictyon sp. TaxID=1846217 RepID=UPI0025EF7B75|nr:Uma2 family endonuclease [uncultured Thiodictyon sp.]